MSEEKNKEDEEEEKKVPWYDEVPSIYIIAAIGILFFKFLGIQNTGGNMSELVVWAVVAALILYLIGRKARVLEIDILKPEEAELALLEDLKRKKREGQLVPNAQWWIGINNGLFHHEGLPQHYQIEFTLYEKYLKYKKAIVFATGNTKGYVTIQDSIGRLRGTEVIPVRTPKIFKKMGEWGLEPSDLLWGKKKNE